MADTPPPTSPSPLGAKVSPESIENSMPFPVATTSAGPGHSIRRTGVATIGVAANLRPASLDLRSPSGVPTNRVASALG